MLKAKKPSMIQEHEFHEKVMKKKNLLLSIPLYHFNGLLFYWGFFSFCLIGSTKTSKVNESSEISLLGFIDFNPKPDLDKFLFCATPCRTDSLLSVYISK